VRRPGRSACRISMSGLKFQVGGELNPMHTHVASFSSLRCGSSLKVPPQIPQRQLPTASFCFTARGVAHPSFFGTGMAQYMCRWQGELYGSPPGNPIRWPRLCPWRRRRWCLWLQQWWPWPTPAQPAGRHRPLLPICPSPARGNGRGGLLGFIASAVGGSALRAAGGTDNRCRGSHSPARWQSVWNGTHPPMRRITPVPRATGRYRRSKGVNEPR